MSDCSDDDIASVDLSGDEGDEEDLIEDQDADGEAEDVMAVDEEMPEPMNMLDDTTAADSDDPRFQKIVWQLKYLPYADDVETEGDQWFVKIKTGLSQSIFKREIRPGLIYWLEELERYVAQYSLRFTKEDHINLIKLFYSVVTMKDCDFRLVKCSCRVLNNLLSRKELLSRDDIELGWRPLYELYALVTYKNLEDDGLFLLPDKLKNTIESAIIACRTYFSKESTQEILNEVRPYFCIWDDSTVRGITVGSLFLNTLMDVETTREYGAGLWFDEFWHWYETIEVNNVMEGKLVSLFMRLSRDCAGFIDWSPKYDFIMSKMMRCLNVTVGTAGNRVGITGSTPVSVDYLTTWLVYLLGGPDDGVQPHLDKLFKATMSYFHPSNGGSHTTHLLTFVNKLCSAFASRLRRERYRKKNNLFHPQVPEELRITDLQIDKFVATILPCIELAAFTKHDFDLVPQICRYLAHLAPWQVVPAVLDMVYSSLDAITEPHRLLQSLTCLSSIVLPLVRDKDDPPEGIKRRAIQSVEDVPVKPYRIFAIKILREILPGIDVNDIAKSLLTFQIIGALLSLIPMVQCSELPEEVMEQLSEEERTLCQATALFDEICDILLENMFRMLEIFRGTNHGGGSHGSYVGLSGQTTKYSIEEAVIRRGLGAVYRCIVSNSSDHTTKKAIDRVYEFASESIFDSKIAADTVAELIFGAVKGDVEYAMPKFLDFLYTKLKEHITPDMYDEEEVDSTVLWYIRLIEDLSRVPHQLTKFRPKFDELVELLLRCKNVQIYDRGCSVLENILLYSTSNHTNVRESRRQQFNDPDFISIRYWAEIVDRKSKNCDIKWIAPGEEEYRWVMDLLKEYLYPTLEKLKKPDDYATSKDMLKDLKLLAYVFDGTAPLLPLLDGEAFECPEPYEAPRLDMSMTVKARDTKEIRTEDGQNVRRVIMEVVLPLAEYLLKHKGDDTRSFKQVNHLMKQLIVNSGISKARLTTLTNQFHFNKKVKGDPVRVSKATVATLHQEFVSLQHARRLHYRWQTRFNNSHFKILKTLLKLAMCDYSAARIEAQHTIVTIVDEFPFVVYSIVDELLEFLDPNKTVPHEQFKGALYMLINGKGSAICLNQDWRLINKIWPALVLASKSEKRSIIDLLDTTQNLVVENFESFQIKFTVPDDAVNCAKELIKEYDNCVHRCPGGLPSVEELRAGKIIEEQRNESTEKLYYTLCKRLYELSCDNTLHWRHSDMAQSFLSMLIRKDQEYPAEAVILFHKLIVSDTVKTRKMAQAILGAWMRMKKPKALKTVMLLENVDPNQGPNAKWPIKYGIRADNRPFLYDKKNLPNTKEKWDNVRFLRKVHHGFYTWPENMTAYNGPGEQLEVNRSRENLTAVETEILKTLGEEGYMNQFIGYMSLEEKKGHESFNAVQFMYYYGLFRNYNDMALEPFKKPLERLMASKKDEEQRLASEIVAGLLNGSKIWNWEKAEKMWAWLEPLLVTCLENVTSTSFSNWGTAVATVLGSCDPRSQYRLIVMLESLADRNTESSFHKTIRYYLLQAALNQGEWRVTECWNDMFQKLTPCIPQTYQNFRERIGSCIATLTYFDIPGFHYDSSIEERFRLTSVQKVIDTFNSYLGDVWATVQRKEEEADPIEMDFNKLSVPGIAGMSACSSSASLMGVGTDESEGKKGLLALSALLNYLQSNWSHSLVSLPEPIIELIPILMHYDNDKTDEDVKKSASWVLQHGISGSVIAKKEIPTMLKVLEKVCLRCKWWKSKLSLLKFMQVIAFANYHVLLPHQDWFKKIVYRLLVDARVEVRQTASETLSGFIQCEFFTVDEEIIKKFATWTNSKVEIQRHAGVLALSAVVRAFPYTVPKFIPGILMKLCRYANDVQSIKATVKDTMKEFKRTHMDSWHVHKTMFTEDQLSDLTNLLVSPCYYV
ncbi:hypothetical protein L596_011872 [Steinernema carpocapsae]|uniref:Proteasome activator complex subunit 4 C-terminal domain-containing protein n=1 Tax=Steinernema carpocapsae TaxID=34508 RepID=A0A4U5NW69_STECR|nr:hypothetical protein L596_011872 [Steinernema carpocapsae]